MSPAIDLATDVLRLLDRIDHLRKGRPIRSAVLARTPSGSVRRIVPSEVIRLRASGPRTVLATTRGEFVCAAGLGTLVAHWRSARIVRCHRSFGVNLDHVRRIEWLPSGAGRIGLSDGSTVRLGRTCRTPFLQRLRGTCAG